MHCGTKVENRTEHLENEPLPIDKSEEIKDRMNQAEIIARSHFGKAVEHMKRVNRKYLAIGLVLIVLIGAGMYLINSQIYYSLQKAIAAGEYAEAAEIYDNIVATRGNSSRLINLTYKTQMEKAGDIRNDFILEKSTNDDEIVEALEALIEIKANSDINKIISEIGKLAGSRLAYENGLAKYKDKDFLDAITAFSKVIEADANYGDAQAKIEEISSLAEEESIDSAKNYAAEGDYKSAVDILLLAKRVLDNDDAINLLVSEYEDLKQQQIVDEYKAQQKISVLSTRVGHGYSYLYNKAYVTVQNNTDQVVKMYVVGILQFDSNGYPINNSYQILDGEGNLKRGRADSPNINPGGTYGNNSYWDIEGDAEKIKACIIEAEFYDGTSWSNPYYDYWYEAEKDRY